MSTQAASLEDYYSTSSSPSSLRLSLPLDVVPSSSSEPAEPPAAPKQWTPDSEYEEVDIGAIVPGPRPVTLMGRIANFYNSKTPSNMPGSAKGCVKMIIKDDSGALTVRLWWRDREIKLKLGQLCSIWAPHVSHSWDGKLSVASAPLFISIFPEGDRKAHIMLHHRSDGGVLCKTPLDYTPGRPIPCLVSLKTYAETGKEQNITKLLVCVKSIGPKREVPNKRQGTSELVNVLVFDDTAEASLTLWGELLHSADPWVPSKTILLITNPQCKINRQISISLSANSLVDVDPDTADAIWLRKYASRLTKRDHINPPCPDGEFGLKTATTQPQRILYNLADVDERYAAVTDVLLGLLINYRVRERPNDAFMGFLTVMILEMKITALYSSNMLFCNECCGFPVHANATTSECKQCEHVVLLRLNPKLVGTMIDESGSLASGKLIWSPTAWEQLLGRTTEQFVASSSELMQYMERRLSYLRLTLCFAWPGEDVGGGRLVVLGIST